MVHGVLGLLVGARFVNGEEPRLARLRCRLDGLVKQGRPRYLGGIRVLDVQLLEDLPTVF